MSVGKRISIVLSALWALLIIGVAKFDYQFNWNIILFGIFVLVLLWGVYWVYLGLTSKPASNFPQKLNQGSSSSHDDEIDFEYEEKLKRFGLKNNDTISPKLLCYLSLASLLIGMGVAAISGMKQFILAGSMGFNLPISLLVTWSYCYTNKIKLKSKNGGLAFIVAYSSLIIGHAIVLN